MTYLILHKVRGEPAFDVAERLQIGDEEGWIIPTSGHRAYPFRWWMLDDLAAIDDINRHGFHDRPASMDDGIPPDWPDHYEIGTGTKPEANFNIMEIVGRLMPKIRRRV